MDRHINYLVYLWYRRVCAVRDECAERQKGSDHVGMLSYEMPLRGFH